jgi:hypothetical protein
MLKLFSMFWVLGCGKICISFLSHSGMGTGNPNGDGMRNEFEK